MLPPPGKWLVQPPPWAALDFDNPILKDVQHVASGAAPLRNRGKYNDTFRTSATPPVPVRQPTGISYNLTGSTGYLATNAGGWVNARTDWTAYVFGVPRSVTSSNGAIATMAETPGSTVRDRSLYISSTSKFVGNAYDTNNRSITSTSSLVVDAPFSGAIRATSTQLSLFINGVSDATPVTLTAAGYGAYVSPELIVGYGRVGGTGTNTAPSEFDLSLLIWWSRALTDAEILSLHQNPWQVFKTPRRTIVPESAAVAYTLDTTPGAYNITGSAATTLATRLVDTTPGAYNLTGSSASLNITNPVLSVSPGAYNITGASVSLLKSGELTAGGGPGKTSKRGWANERARFEESLRTEEVAEQVKAARRVLKKAQSESAQRLGELVAEYEAARASLDELREQVARIERESRLREEVEVATKVVEIFAREEEDLLAILEIIDEMDARALVTAMGLAA